MFQLHPQLEADTITLTSLDVSRVLLMNDRRYPWIILVPEIESLREVHELKEDCFRQVMAEMRDCSKIMQSLFGADKMNIAALGNMVPQLHIHIIARFEKDAAWPGPIWGVGDIEPYTDSELAKNSTLIKEALSP